MIAMMAATLSARAILGMHHVKGLLGGVVGMFLDAIAMSGQGHILARAACCLSQQARRPKFLSPGLLMTSPRASAKPVVICSILNVEC